MALEKNTVQTILQMVSDIRGETTTNTDSVRVRAVSRSHQDYAGRRFFLEHLLRDQTTTGDGTNDYSIGSVTFPMRKKGLAELFVDGTTEAHRYAIVDFFVFQNLVNRNSAERIAYEWYDQTNDAWKVHINPAPDSGETITYSYFFMPAEVDETADYVYCSDPNILALLTAARVFRGEDEEQRALLLKQEAEQLISDQLGVENAPAVNQLYSMSPIESQVSAKGIGSY